MTAAKEKKVKEIMRPVEEYAWVKADSTVKEAILTLKQSFDPDGANRQDGHQTILVDDKKGGVQGILTFNALMRAVEPQFIKVDQWAVPVFWEGLFTERCREEAGKTVREVMIPIGEIALDADDTLLKAVHTMLKHDLNSLPVIKDKSVVGMIRIAEIFQEIGGMLAGQPAVSRPLPGVPKAMSF